VGSLDAKPAEQNMKPLLVTDRQVYYVASCKVKKVDCPVAKAKITGESESGLPRPITIAKSLPTM
jgi:hypothetical protein